MIYTRFRHLAISCQKTPPSQAQIASIEALLGVQLPQSFRDFLDVANGGYIDYIVDVPVGANSIEQMSFSQFFSSEEGRFCDETLVGEIRAAREHVKAPPQVLPFARDGGGSVLYLDLTPEGAGRVVAYVDGLPSWTGRRAESGFVQVAASFDEYLEKLRLDRDTLLDTLEVDTTTPEHLEALLELLDIGLPGWRTADRELGLAVAKARARITASALIEPAPPN